MKKTGIVPILKVKNLGLAGLVVILACGLTSCLALLFAVLDEDSEESSVYPEVIEAREVVYREIPYSELDESIKKVNSPGNGFVVEAYFIDTYAYAGTGGTYRISDTSNGTPSRWFNPHEGDEYDSKFNYVTPHQFEIYNDETYRRIDETKKYRIFFGVYQHKYEGYWTTFIDKIEGLWTWEEVAAIEEKQKAEAEAKRKAEEEAAAIAREAKFNPNKFNRSQYKATTVEEFTFDMVAGKFNVGTKISFVTTFIGKPTGTEYNFKGIDFSITFSSTHNFVRDMPERCFDWGLFSSQYAVRIFATVKSTGRSRECSVDIVEW
jgi:hypothetical protein